MNCRFGSGTVSYKFIGIGQRGTAPCIEAWRKNSSILPPSRTEPASFHSRSPVPNFTQESYKASKNFAPRAAFITRNSGNFSDSPVRNAMFSQKHTQTRSQRAADVPHLYQSTHAEPLFRVALPKTQKDAALLNAQSDAALY